MGRKRIAIYAQHLSGVGHHVRTREIGRALAEAHDVFLVHGGRGVPGGAAGERPVPIQLPAIHRSPQGLAPTHRSGSLAAVLRERSDALRRAMARTAPDVLLVEHYPFSKWELEAEIEAMIEAAQLANPRVNILCSARDVLRQTRHERLPAQAYRRRVVSKLNGGFHGLFVHSDPRFTRLEEHFASAHEIGIPVAHTGFVSEKPGPEEARHQARARAELGRGYVVVSVGGGAGSAELAGRVAEAWRHTGGFGSRRLVIFAGLFWSERDLARLGQRERDLHVKPFGPDFLGWLRGADLSISRAGYNTCMNLLETRTRALLCPDPGMSDQVFRARRMAERGLAACVEPGETSLEALCERIRSALRREPPVHRLDLGGAARTREQIEALP